MINLTNNIEKRLGNEHC